MSTLQERERNQERRVEIVERFNTAERDRLRAVVVDRAREQEEIQKLEEWGKENKYSSTHLAAPAEDDEAMNDEFNALSSKLTVIQFKSAD